MKNIQAFPGMDLNISSVQQGKTPDHLPYFGMTLRDYFAAKAMQGMLTNQPLRVDVMLNGDSLAQSSYQIADAMMKEREQK